MEILQKIKANNGTELDLSKIGIIYNTDHSSAESVANSLNKTLSQFGYEKNKLVAISGKNRNKQYTLPDITMAFIIGGDGTFLGASRFFAPHNIPLFGINTGRLGFLSQLVPEELDKGIEKILNGKFTVEERLMIKSTLDFGQTVPQTALNDIVIKGGDVSRTMKLYLYINNKHVCDYIADGLIISTPTGSTAYTLSAGGPVISPQLEAFVVVPICPHTLTTRPIVIPSCENITVKLKTDSECIYVTADGQENAKLCGGSAVNISKYEHKAKLIQIKDENDSGFYGILREKLHWGVSPGY